VALVERTDFVSLSIDDVERSIAFYRDTLGLECSAPNVERGYAEFETGSLTINVFEARRMGREHVPGGATIALHVADVAAARAELEARGVAFRGDILDTGVCHMAFFADPDGNGLLLHHRYAPRPPKS